MNTISKPAGGHEMSWNFKLIAQHELDGFGGLGEGMSIQIAKDGRRILWLAHENAPKNFTGVDVSDLRNPKVVVQTELPAAYLRSNSLEIVGDIMAVAYQTKLPGQAGAGFELFDISTPEQPRSVAFVDCSGPYSRGVHQLWFVDGEYIHMASGAGDFQPRNQLDDQFYRIFDVRDPSNPREAGRWWLPGTREGDAEPAPVRHAAGSDFGFRAHNTNVYPERPDRAYIGYLDAGAIVLDISDKSSPKVVSRWDNSPPYHGFTHTLMPLFGRDLYVITDECVTEDLSDWPKMIWVVDAREEANPIPISTLPLPARETFGDRGGRFGAHNIHENVPTPYSWVSEEIIIGTFFNGGIRAYDISDAFQPREVGYYVPPAPPLSPTGSIQLNDVFVDERGIVYTVDRHVGGLYILEMDF